MFNEHIFCKRIELFTKEMFVFFFNLDNYHPPLY